MIRYLKYIAGVSFVACVIAFNKPPMTIASGQTAGEGQPQLSLIIVRPVSASTVTDTASQECKDIGIVHAIQRVPMDIWCHVARHVSDAKSFRGLGEVSRLFRAVTCDDRALHPELGVKKLNWMMDDARRGVPSRILMTGSFIPLRTQAAPSSTLPAKEMLLKVMQQLGSKQLVEAGIYASEVEFNKAKLALEGEISQIQYRHSLSRMPHTPGLKGGCCGF